MDPITREEQYLKRIAEKNGNIPNRPITREETYLAKMCGENVTVPEPITRKEKYYKAIIDGGVSPTPAVLVEKSINENGDYNASDDSADGYSAVHVAVSQTILDTLTATENGTYTAPEGYAYSQVVINVTTAKIAGISVDFDAGTVERISDSRNWLAGVDYDSINAFGGRKRCNVADDGTILAWYGDLDYAEDGSNGQVMVYQPKFYYKVEPVETGSEAISEGNTSVYLKKANYYVSDAPYTGFKLHPLFYNEAGEELDFVLKSAFEGSMYDVSAQSYVTDLASDTVTLETGDLMCSVGGQKPISGNSAILSKPNAEILCANRGNGWHLETIQDASAEQILMIVEFASFNTQSAIESGVTGFVSGNGNEASQTGYTTQVTGHADATVHIASDGTETTETTVGKRSICYRGVENFWGNIWKHINGINVWGNGSMNGGQAYVCSDFNYNESKHDGNYNATGLYYPNANGYVKYFGYNASYDWLFIPSSTVASGGTVSAYAYVSTNLDSYRIARLGGSWNSGAVAGAFFWLAGSGVDYRARYIGGRSLHITSSNNRSLRKSTAKMEFLPDIFDEKSEKVVEEIEER